MEIIRMNEVKCNVPAQYTEMFAHALKALTANYKKHVRWHAKCDAYSAGQGDAPKLSSMPSKNAKYKMYDEANRMIHMSGLELARPSTLAEIGALIEVFKN